MFKSLIRRGLLVFGYDLLKSSDMKYLKKWPNYQEDLYLKIYGEETCNDRRFYNVGGGTFYHPYWTNIDNASEFYGYETKHIGINHDLLTKEPLPIDSDSAEMFYSSKLIEHITDECNEVLFKEAYRALKKGGVFRVVAPDMEIYLNYFKEDNINIYNSFLEYYGPSGDWKKIQLGRDPRGISHAQLFLHQFAASVTTHHPDPSKKTFTDEEVIKVFEEKSMEEAFDYFCSHCDIEIQKKYPGNHLNWFTKDKLVRMLEAAGFEEVYVSAFGQSKFEVLRNTEMFDLTAITDGVFVEAVKR